MELKFHYSATQQNRSRRKAVGKRPVMIDADRHPPLSQLLESLVPSFRPKQRTFGPVGLLTETQSA